MLELERRESGKSPEFPGEIGIADLGRVDAGQRRQKAEGTT